MLEEPATLTHRLRDALALHPENFSKFFETLSAAEREQVREMIILAEEFRTRGLTGLLGVHTRPDIPNFIDPVDELKNAFHNLIYKAQTRLSSYGKELIFGQWIDVLTKILGPKHSVMLRYLMMTPAVSKYKITRMIAKENEAFPANERSGWTSTDPDTIKRLINEELQKHRAPDEPPPFNVIEGGRKTP